ncbi:MAG: hypothetical protein ACFFC7_20715 [Candidatus Hermodarchaeota archaeon]
MVNIYAVYIINTAGICVFKKTLAKNMPDPDLISSFLSAVDTFASEVIGGDVRTFKIEQITYCFRDFRDFFVVIGMDKEYKKIDVLLEKIGMAFMIEHGADLKPWKGSTQPFRKFEATLEKLLEEAGFKKDIWDVIFPTKSLDVLELGKIPEDVRKVAMALLTIRKGTLEDIIEELELEKPVMQETIEFIRRALAYLIEEGLCGYNQQLKIYFLS